MDPAFDDCGEGGVDPAVLLLQPHSEDEDDGRDFRIRVLVFGYLFGSNLSPLIVLPSFQVPLFHGSVVRVERLHRQFVVHVRAKGGASAVSGGDGGNSGGRFGRGMWPRFCPE